MFCLNYYRYSDIHICEMIDRDIRLGAMSLVNGDATIDDVRQLIDFIIQLSTDGKLYL